METMSRRALLKLGAGIFGSSLASSSLSYPLFDYGTSSSLSHEGSLTQTSSHCHSVYNGLQIFYPDDTLEVANFDTVSYNEIVQKQGSFVGVSKRHYDVFAVNDNGKPPIQLRFGRFDSVPRLTSLKVSSRSEQGGFPLYCLGLDSENKPLYNEVDIVLSQGSAHVHYGGSEKLPTVTFGSQTSGLVHAGSNLVSVVDGSVDEVKERQSFQVRGNSFLDMSFSTPLLVELTSLSPKSYKFTYKSGIHEQKN